MNERDVLAELTFFFHWGPRDAEALTWTEAREWVAQARRIQGIKEPS